MSPEASKIRVGMIGVGQIGKRHVETYSKMTNVEIVGIADIDEPEARRVAGLYGVPYVTTNFRGTAGARRHCGGGCVLAQQPPYAGDCSRVGSGQACLLRETHGRIVCRCQTHVRHGKGYGEKAGHPTRTHLRERV